MKLIIETEHQKVNLLLFNRQKIVGRFSFLENKNLSEKLLLSIDKLIRSQGYSPENVKKVAVKSRLPKQFLAWRIIKTVEKVWNFSINN